IRTRGVCPYKDRANEEMGICCRSTASVQKPPAPFAPGPCAPTRTELTRRSGSAAGAPPRCENRHPIRTRGVCPYKDRANEEMGICCRSTASVQKPPAPFAPGPCAPTRTELTRRSGSAVGAPPRCENRQPIRTRGGCSCKDRANEEI